MTHFYLSDCGKYLARYHDGGCLYDVLTVDGSQCWLSTRYDHAGLTDTDPRVVFPEFAHEVIGYSYRGEQRGVDVFELTFADLDQSQAIQPGMGNCVQKKYRATFSRRFIIRAKPKRKGK